MDFLKLIQSLDELLYEVMSWLLFYPITLWRAATSPLQTMRLVESELAETEDLQFDDLLPPPLFLLLTLVLIHVVELGTVGQSDMVRNTVGLNRLINNDTNLIIFRILVIALLPLIAARRLLKSRNAGLDKRRLKPPFYAQCYAAGVFALLFNLAQFAGRQQMQNQELANLAAIALALVWLLIVEARWFSISTQGSALRGFGQALLMFGQWLTVLFLIGMAMN